MRLSGRTTKKVLIPLLGLIHFGTEFAVPVVGRTWLMNDRRIDRRVLAQHQTTVTQVAVDNLQNPACQLMFFQQA